MAVFAPHANSYRRFRAMSYAPVAPTWGVNNRSVSLRVPAGPPASRHVEHRVAGADANPYLVAALVLAGMLRASSAASIPARPSRQWIRAGACRRVADALARGPGARGGIGVPCRRVRAEFLEVFLAVKRRECEKFGALVTDRDYEWYLDGA